MGFVNVMEIFGKHKTDAGQTRVNVSSIGNLATDGQLVDLNGESLTVDTITRALTTITYPHHEMHSGSHYFIKTWLINTGGSGTFDEFIFVTPNTTKRIHAKVNLNADADATFQIFEDATMTALGTPVPGINNNRDSVNVSELAPYAAPTVNTDGNLIWAARNGGGRTPIGVGLGTNFEILAKTNSIYLFRLTKNTTADTVIDIDFFWYEHINKA